MPRACIGSSGGTSSLVYMTISVSIKPDLQQRVCTLLAQLAQASSLDYAEEQWPLILRNTLLLHQPLELVLAAPRPLDGSLDRFLLGLKRIIHMRAVVEADDDIGPVADL